MVKDRFEPTPVWRPRSLTCSLQLVVAAGVMLATGCSVGLGSDQAAVRLELATTANGSISVGQVLEVSVEENGSVGDAWVLWDPDSLQHLVVNADSIESECEDGKVGCGGTHTFRLEGRSAGVDEVVLVNCFRQGSSCVDDLTAAEVAALPDHLTDFGPPPVPFALRATITVTR